MNFWEQIPYFLCANLLQINNYVKQFSILANYHDLSFKLHLALMEFSPTQKKPARTRAYPKPANNFISLNSICIKFKFIIAKANLFKIDCGFLRGGLALFQYINQIFLCCN